MTNSILHHGLYVTRKWGRYRVDEEGPFFKIKTLFISPGLETSYQRHFHRSEVWLIKSGIGKIIIDKTHYSVGPGSVLVLSLGRWHQIINASDSEELVIHEIQYGERCEEEDIERAYTNK